VPLQLITIAICEEDLFQLRYLQTLNSIAAEHTSTIIFPMPIDIGHLGRMLK
jgi:hypothetical protein